MPASHPELEQFFDRVEACYPHANAPGYAAALVVGNRVVLRRCYGLANIEWARPIGRDTVFHIGSGTKPLTALLVAHAVVEGRLGLDDDARARLPFLDTFPHPLPVAQLLNHTAGVPNYISLGGRALDASGQALTAFHRNDYLGQERVRHIVRALGPAQAPPEDRRFRYANTNFFILAELLAVSYGDPLPLLARRKLFDTAGMEATHFEYDRYTVVPRRATAYEPDLRRFGTYRPRLKNFDMLGDSGLLSTLDDLTRWEVELKRRRKVGDDALRLIEHAPWTPAEHGLSYGYGFICGAFHGLAFQGHPGRMDGFKCLSLRFPDVDTSFIYLANCDVPGLNSWQFIDQVARAVSAAAQ